MVGEIRNKTSMLYRLGEKKCIILGFLISKSRQQVCVIPWKILTLQADLFNEQYGNWYLWW